MYNNFQYKLRYLFLRILFILCTGSSLHAQYSMGGSPSVNQNKSSTYTIYGSNIAAVSWSLDQGGEVISQTTPNPSAPPATPAATATIQWTGTGTAIVKARVYDTSLTNPVDVFMTVTITPLATTPPSIPPVPKIKSNSSGVVVLEWDPNGMPSSPPNGVTWYWQSSSFGESLDYANNTRSLTSGTAHYLRARNDIDGTWSLNSSSVNYTIVSSRAPDWYFDTDGDGLGDANNIYPIPTFTQPASQWVSNGEDQCPDVFGSSINNGCPLEGNSNDKTYTHTIIPLVAINNMSQLTSEDQALKSVTYYDGLKRPIQNVARQAGGNRQDIITPIIYDRFGRQTAQYLPYADATQTQGSPLGYINNVTLISNLETYYTNKYSNEINSSSPNPYSQTVFESSPLNRVLETASPGKDWAVNINSDNDHTIKNEYGTNMHNEVHKIDYPGVNQPLSIASFYIKNRLLKNIVKNENWVAADGKLNTKEVFTDKNGRKIAEYSYIKEDSVLKTLKTHYVYDDIGNLVYTLTPKIFSTISGATISVNHLNDLAFQYRFDDYNRLIEQKTPGKNWEYMVYDQMDRLILTQDANLKKQNKWLFNKYDVFGRVIYSGTYINSTNRTSLQIQADNFITGNVSNIANIESRSNTLTNVGGININYTNNGFPNTSLEVLSVSYFDDYNFSDTNIPTMPTSVFGQDVTNRTKALLTSTWTKTLSETGTSWTKNYYFYDEKARIIYVHNINHLGGTTKNKSKLDFRGKVVASLTEHQRTLSDGAVIIKDYFTYDHLERPISHTQSIGGESDLIENSIVLDVESPISDQTKEHKATQSITISSGFNALNGFSAKIESDDRELIAYNTYDELGQLVNEKTGGKANNIIKNSEGLQMTNYTYNVRGWLTNVNDVENMGDNLFAYKMKYNDAIEGNATVSNLYNGNIKQVVWKSKYDNVKKTYAFEYDKLNRFSSSHYRENNTLSDGVGKFETYDLDYDFNGNIKGLKRNDQSALQIDELNYTYDAGNKLLTINDATANTSGFNDGSLSNDYDYDTNGNLIQDLNKDITEIKYNHLDLVKKVTFINGNTIEFNYDAKGSKLQMKTTIDNNVITIDYLGGFQYKDMQLQFFPIPQGYVLNNNGDFSYVYQYKDHLGSVRLSYRDINNDGTVSFSEIMSNTNYYAMGLTHSGAFVQNSNYNFKFQGKEQLLSGGYNMYNFGSRMYDPAVGRWFNTDPQNEFYSPYVAMANNYVMVVDPDGELSWLLGAIGGVFNLLGDWARGELNSWDDALISFTAGAVGSIGKNNYEEAILASSYNQFQALAYGSSGPTVNIDITHNIKFKQSLNTAITQGDLTPEEESMLLLVDKGMDFTAGAQVGASDRVEHIFNFVTRDARNSSYWLFKANQVLVSSKKFINDYLDSGESDLEVFVGNRIYDGVTAMDAYDWGYGIGYSAPDMAFSLGSSYAYSGFGYVGRIGLNGIFKLDLPTTNLGANSVWYPRGSFSVLDWNGYPAGAIKPAGPFRLLEGTDYSSARKLADKTNSALHKANPELKGLHIHEIHPVKFNGNPTDLSNKIYLRPIDHYPYNNYWNRLQRGIENN